MDSGIRCEEILMTIRCDLQQLGWERDKFQMVRLR
ncbi:MAG: hypothetical protein DDT19_02770 [Syntrophomonadaceae bacterium]|nr:hypothetical protein [Bacillota bacterium]